eukprot:TRINITY_DN1630_c0_g4_i1.p1 TRINITY_DN1630_c0_g4~~TRINITY_DN1630_c0_g4_i1.p1  ORF type:complete len:445 (-),score=67.26 TRINITY_DN1630_c0_g4_i1:393-1727(-)
MSSSTGNEPTSHQTDPQQIQDDTEVIRTKGSLITVVARDSPSCAAEPHSTAEGDTSSTQAEEVKSKWKSQAPDRFVLAAGVVLAGCAGYVNATAKLICGSFVSHVTGTTARLGMAIEGHYADSEDAHKIYQASFLVLSFLMGATMCGLLVSRNEVHFGKAAYGVALLLNSLLLLLAVGVFDWGTPESWPSYMQSSWIAVYLQSAACGLQNGMCTAHFGAVVRTTHLTGLATDSGLTIGRLMSIILRARCNRRNFRPLDWAELSVDLKKMVVFLSLFAGYVVGVCIGAAVSDVLGIHALFIPASITGVGGITYAVAKARYSAAFDEVEAEKLARDLCEAEEIFERARHSIADWSTTLPRQASNLAELDEEVGKALNLLHDMEAVLHEKMARRSTDASNAKQLDDRARRIVSAPSVLITCDLESGVPNGCQPSSSRQRTTGELHQL